MPPDWLQSDFDLSSDLELRRLQIRWAKDDVWMRRLAFCVSLLIAFAGMTLLVLGDGPGFAAEAATTGGLLSAAGSRYYLAFPARRPRRDS
jgi:hypothetical protein